MGSARKSSQLQIRVSPAQKRAIQRAAQRAGMGASEWVLSRALPPASERFRELARRLAASASGKHAFAEIHDLLTELTVDELAEAVASRPDRPLDAVRANTLAAMVETACAAREVEAPAWTRDVEPLAEPHFASELESLRLHLLLSSPPAFRRRNLFVDSTLGARV